MNPADEPIELLVMAAEPSGDRVAARVVERVSRRRPCRWFGIGGDLLLGAGVEIVHPIDRLTALGIGDLFGRIGEWAEAWAKLRAAAAKRRPRVALLVDSPEVNLPLARILRAAGARVVFYVGPQVWAWRKGRLDRMRRRVDMAALVLPFEAPLYAKSGVNAVFVGHPILDEPDPVPRRTVREKLGLAPEQPLVALLPGSRPGEVKRHANAMLGAGRMLGERSIATVFAPRFPLPRVPGSAGDPMPLPAGLSGRDLLGAADAAIISSGTATLEAAVLGTPMAIVYRLDRPSWMAARCLVKAPYVGLPNWVAGRQIVPELLQGEMTDRSLFDAALALLEPAEQGRQKQELERVTAALGDPGAADRVSALVLERIG